MLHKNISNGVHIILELGMVNLKISSNRDIGRILMMSNTKMDFFAFNDGFYTFCNSGRRVAES